MRIPGSAVILRAGIMQMCVYMQLQCVLFITPSYLHAHRMTHLNSHTTHHDLERTIHILLPPAV